MLELRTYTDDELIEALEIAPSTLKSKRKVTESRHLKNYVWSRDKKAKLYTIQAYRTETIEDTLFDTFESLIFSFNENASKVPLKNLDKALRILVALYFTDESFPSKIGLTIDEKAREVSRYVNKFKDLDILVKDEYDYYLVCPDDFTWEEIDKIQYDNIVSFWAEEFYECIDKYRVSAIDSDPIKLKLCRDIASHKVEDNFGFLRKVSKKDLTNEAKEHFGEFLRYSNEQLRMLFEDSIPVVD